MMNPIFIISPLVGSVIGYFTNWLAIKMLFRPLTEKRIFGIKIPLTPGVIPSRREKIAISIGKAVGDVILTPEAFQQVLEDERLHNRLNKYLTDKIDDLKNEDRTGKEIIEKFFIDKDETDKIKAEIKNIIYDILDKFISDGVLVNLIKDSEVINKKNLKKVISSREYQKLKDEIFIYLKENIKEDTLEEVITQFMTNILNKYKTNNQKLKTIISLELQQAGEEFIVSLTPFLKEHLIAFLESDRAEEIIATEIDSFMGRNKLLMMVENFISRDKIASLIINYLLDIFKKEKGTEILEEQLQNLYQRVLALELGSILNKIDENEIEQLSGFIAEEVVKKGLLIDLIQEVETKFRNNILKNPRFEDELISYLEKLISNNKLLLNTIYFFAFKSFNELLKKPVKDYIMLMDEKELEKIKDIVLLIFNVIFEYYVYDVVKVFDFRELVVSRINTFDVLEVENLLLEVIETELKAITWFGAFLGLWMGLVTPLVNLFL